MTALDWRAIATSERDQQGMFRIQPMPVGINDGGGSGSYLSLLPTSFFARPLDVERDVDQQPIKSCDGLIGEDGEERFVLPATDGRVMTILPDPGKGGGSDSRHLLEGELCIHRWEWGGWENARLVLPACTGWEQRQS